MKLLEHRYFWGRPLNRLICKIFGCDTALMSVELVCRGYWPRGLIKKKHYRCVRCGKEFIINQAKCNFTTVAE